MPIACAYLNLSEKSMFTFLINTIGILIIAFIIWWFWLSKKRTYITNTNEVIEIKVKNGVYEPAYIKSKLNVPIILRFTREDSSACSEMVIFNELNISQKLPLNHSIDIQLILKNPGEYEFTCQMGMYHGKIIGVE
jgi:plastocyanin domain-containing protein